MNPLVIFILELFIIFVTSRYIFKSLFLFFLIFFKSQRIAITFLSIIFFIGVALHELSHMLIAEVLQVRTHGIELIPEVREGRLKMGSVQVSKTDFARSFLIGIAPLVLGCALIISSLWFLQSAFNLESIFSSPISILFAVLIVYVLFVVANTMFSSQKDMEGAVELLVILGCFEVGAFFVHVPINQFLLSLASKPGFENVMSQVNLLFALPVGVNILAAMIFFLFFKKKRLA